MKYYSLRSHRTFVFLTAIWLAATTLLFSNCSSEIHSEQQTSSNTTEFGDDLESLFRGGYDTFRVHAVPVRPTVGEAMEFHFDGFDTETAVVAYECTADPDTLADPDVFDPDEFSLYDCSSFNINQLNNNILVRTLEDVGLAVHLFLYLVREQQGEAPGRYAGSTLVDVQPEGGGSGECDKPGPHNTGPITPDNLTRVSRDYVHANMVDGAVFEGLDIDGNVNVTANNVTFRNFKLDAGTAPFAFRMDYGKTGILFEDGEIIGMDSAALYGSEFTARRLNIHESGHDAIKSQYNVYIECSWIHHLGTIPEAHADGNQTRHGANLTFRRNNFDMPIDLPGYASNAALINMTHQGPIDNMLIEENWINGGNYSVYFEDKGYGAPSNTRLINNRFGRDYRFGPLVNDGGYSTHIEGNVWDDTGELMDINNR